MSINVNTKNYDTAKEYLLAAATPLEDISLDIATAIQNLDSRIIPYVIEDYNYVNNQIKNVYASNEILSTEIENFKQKCKNIEDKATGAISSKQEAQLTSISAAASESLTAQLLQVEEQAVIQNHIDNQEIAYLTSSIVSDPTSTLSYTTPYVDDIEAAVQQEMDATGAETGEKTESFWGKVGNFFLGIGKYIHDSIFHPVKTFIKTSASLTNFAISLVNGVLNFVEALIDCVALIVSAAASIFTGLFDLCQWIGGKITGNEDWESVTKKMWKNGTMKFVATKFFDKGFEWFYQNTAIGKTLDNLSYEPFKSTGGVYSFGKGVGYVVGVVILAIVTYGVGGAAAGAGGAAGSASSAAAGAAGSAAASSASSLAASATAVMTTAKGAAVLGAVGAAAGTGKNTQNAWADGAGLGEGLAYGVAAGAYEGLQFYAGARINALKIPGASQLGNSAAHVALDTVDGASSGFIDPMLKMIYTPNEQNMEQIMYYVNYDENGNLVNNKTWDELTFGQKYKALFEYNGGWKTVGRNAAIAGALSTITEIPDVAAAIKTPKVELDNASREAVEQGLKTTDVDTGVAKNITEGSESVVKETGASFGAKLRKGASNVKSWIQEKSGAVWATGKAKWHSFTDWIAAKKAGKTVSEVIDTADTTVKTVDAIDTTIAKTGAERVAEAKSALDEALKSKKPKAIKDAGVEYVKASYSAFKEKIAKAIDNIPGVKKAKQVKQNVTDTISDSVIVQGAKKAGKKVVDAFNNNPIKKGLDQLRQTDAAIKSRKIAAGARIGPVKTAKIESAISKIKKLSAVDTSKMTADELTAHLKEIADQKNIIAKQKVKTDLLSDLIPFEEQVDLDMILLTDKMKRVLKTDKTYLTNQELMSMVEQETLDDFIKYVDSQPKMTKEEYQKVYKRFVLCLGLTGAGYFVLNGDYKN